MSDRMMDKLDALIDTFTATGSDRLDLYLGSDERRQLRDEITATCPTVPTEQPQSGTVVERYRGHRIVLMQQPGVYAVGYSDRA